MSRIIALISGMTGVITGIVMLVCAVTDATLPKAVYAVFSVACLANAALIIWNYKRKK